MAVKRRGLGKGLDALLNAGDVGGAAADAGASGTDPASGASLREIPVDLILRGQYQPRREMDQEALQELADSIRTQGIVQPIVVRSIAGDKYEIIAGERRWRAAQLAGLDFVPALVRDMADDAAVVVALIENLQREDLNPIEEAAALRRLQDEFGLTQQEVADAVGKSRTTVTNLMRLMSLVDDVRTMLEKGDLEMGHARALLGLPSEQQSAAARSVVAKGLTVRQTEALVRQYQAEGKRRTGKAKKPQALDPNIRALQDDLSQKLGTRVQIQHTAKGGGKLVLSYGSLDELDGILGHIK